MAKPRRVLGLIVNPVAGLGGRVGLKGSDGAEIQRRARELGALPEALNRTAQALRPLERLKDRCVVVTYPREMGEDVARACGLEPVVVGSIEPGRTTAEDTRRAAQDLSRFPVDLILFAGGDGTARDVYTAIGGSVPVLGIPAGVKIQSAVYAIHPASAGELAALYLEGKATVLRDAEVLDLDEAAYRQGIVSPRLYGYLRIPFERGLVQNRKAPSPLSERGACESIAWAVIDRMQAGWLYIVGPGTTTQPVLANLGLPKTLIGVDVVCDRQLLAADANEARLLELIENRSAMIVITPIGGQGYLFGRGNQQLSPAVIRAVGKSNILVVSTVDKIHSLQGRPLLVDTGDLDLDRLLAGYIQVITGRGERIVYRVAGGDPPFPPVWGGDPR